MKVIIFTETKVGEGHYQAAKSLRATFRQLYADDVEVKIMSGLRCIHPFIEWFIVRTYFFMLAYCPKIWKVMYTHTKKSSFIQTYLFGIRLVQIIKDENPDIILCTHPSCVPALSQIKKKSTFRFKLGVICTDFDFHPYLMSTYVDYFFVSHQGSKEKMINIYGIQAERIFDYGIPLDPQFEYNPPNLVTFKNKNQKQILILGGSTGYGPLEELINIFEPFQAYFKLTVITGKNKKLYQKLIQQSENVRVLGYVTNMKEWLQFADIIISKPGGLTISEAISCGTPFIMINPIPGHEEANQRYLEQQGVGISVKDVKDLPFKVLDMVNDDEELRQWKKRIQAQQKKQSAKKIVYTLMEA
jgi:processive 1,2-diacylglycerol beta-glucosyltransferase